MLKLVRSEEAGLAWTQVLASKDLAVVKAFRTAYKGWPEAQKALIEAYSVEAQLALAHAERLGTDRALAAVAVAYPYTKAAQQARSRIALRLFKPLLLHLAHNTIPSAESLRRLLEHSTSAELRSAAAPHEAAFWRAITRTRRIDALRLFRDFYPSSAHAVKAAKLELRAGAPAR